MKTIYKAISKIFRLFIIFLISLIWCRYFIKNFTISIILTILLTILIDIILTFIFYTKNKKINLKNSEINKAQNYCNKFIFSEKSYTINFFYNLFAKKFKTTKTTKYIIIENNNSKCVIYPIFKLEDLSTEDLVNAYNTTKKHNPQKLILCVNKANSNVINIANMLDVKTIILDKFQTYQSIYKEFDTYPEEYLIKTEKTTIKSLLEYGLNKKRTKGYLLASLILLFSSMIVKYNLYYLIVSSILLVLALFSFINPKYNKKLKENIFD